MLRGISLASAVAVLSLAVLFGGCANRQQAQRPPSQRVAGTQQRASIVNATLTNTGLTVQQKQVQPGNVTLKVMNNGTAARTVEVTGPNNFKKNTGSIKPGQAATLSMPNLKQGTYHVYVQGMQTRANMNRTFMVAPKTTTAAAKATTVAATLTSSGLTLSPKQAPAGNITLNVTNKDTKARTVEVTGPNNFKKSTGTIQPGKTAMLDLPNAKQGDYRVFVAGMQNRTGMSQTLKVTPSTTAAAKTATVDGTITATGLTLKPKQVQANTVDLAIKNDTKTAQTVDVKGPNNVTKSTGTIQPGQTGMVTIANAQAGTYRVYVQGKPSEAQNLVVTTAAVAGTREQLATVTLALTDNKITASPTTVETTGTGPVIFNGQNKTGKAASIVSDGRTLRLQPNQTKPLITLRKSGTNRWTVTNNLQGTTSRTAAGKPSTTTTTTGATPATVTVTWEKDDIMISPATVSAANPVKVDMTNTSGQPITFSSAGRTTTLRPNETTTLFTLEKSGTNQWNITSGKQSTTTAPAGRGTGKGTGSGTGM